MDVYKALETAIKQRAFKDEHHATVAAQLMQRSGEISPSQVQELIKIAIDSYLLEGSNHSHKPYDLNSPEAMLEFLKSL